MDTDQFNELLSYQMIIALNTSTLLFQQSRQTRLTPEEMAFCQDELFRTARGIQARLAQREQPFDVPSFGRADD